MSRPAAFTTVLLLALCLEGVPLPAQPPAPASSPPSTRADSASFREILATTTSALDSLRARYQLEQGALALRLAALDTEARQTQQAVALAAEWRDTLRLVRAQVASLQAAAAARRERDTLAAATIEQAQREAHAAGLRVLDRMHGMLGASANYLSAYDGELAAQRTLSLWEDPQFRSVWDTADRMGTALGLAVAGYGALRGGDDAEQRIGIGLAGAAVARAVGWLFGGRDALHPDGVRQRLEAIAMTRQAYDDIAGARQRVDSLRRQDGALLAELDTFRLRYVAAATDPAARAEVLGALPRFLDRYMEALRQPVLLVGMRHAALQLYAGYDLPAERRAALLTLVDELAARESSFAEALRADAGEVDRLRALLERASMGALLAELVGPR